MPLVATRGAASAQGFGEFGAVTAVNYIEDVFSTYLYTGNGSTQTITNGIDLSGNGGLVWIKGRSGATGHRLTDTARGATKSLESNSDLAQATEATGLTAFNGTGFTIGADADYNTNTATYVSWAFRKQAKFFDVVTYTGNGVAGRTVPHNLGSVPGCIIVKRLDGANENWRVYHRSLGNTQSIQLNLSTGPVSGAFYWNNTSPTSTNFTVGDDTSVNADGWPFVAYLFAHDAGGFGLTGTDNVISCGSFTTNGFGNATVTLGYEPQWVMFKKSSSTGPWYMLDVMRQWAYSDQNYLTANTSNAESGVGAGAANYPTATGFNTTGAFTDASSTYIYIAIRRGPMKVPTSGTSVFAPVTYTGDGTTGTPPSKVISVGFLVDMQMLSTTEFQVADSSSATKNTISRLTGLITTAAIGNSTPSLFTSSNGLETGVNGYSSFNNSTFAVTNSVGALNVSGRPYITWNFRRAPGFFDVVCYTGTGVNRTVNHNLAAVPQFMIIKSRSAGADWAVYSEATTSTGLLQLNTNTAKISTGNRWNSTAPTASVFSVGITADVNTNGTTYIAYLFASAPGVSKVGSYTGTGTTKQIDCGFTGGARFVLIKRTDSTGDWYVWDSARGIVAGNDPYLLLNSNAAEVTNTDYVDTYSAGFEISSTAPAAINANGGTYIFLAVS